MREHRPLGFSAFGGARRREAVRELVRRSESAERRFLGGTPWHDIARPPLALPAVERADETGERLAQEEKDAFARRNVDEAHVVSVQPKASRARDCLQCVLDGGSAGLADVQEVQRAFERRHLATIMPDIALVACGERSSR